MPPMAMASSSKSNDDEFQLSSSDMITTLHQDIINSHILTRLDGPDLASAAASSSQLRRLCTQHHLWLAISTATWPSLTHPLASQTISTFPNSHRSIFSDSFPSLHPNHPSPPNHNHQPQPSPQLISAVDIYYKGEPVFSRVHRTETRKGWFLCSPLWIDLLEPNEMVPTPLKFAKSDNDDEWLNHLEENLGLSWIAIDPTRKRAANVSSRQAVSARRHWLTGEAEVVYAVAVEEGAYCVVKVTCCGKAGGEMQVREVSLTMENLEGRHVMGRDSMVILQRAMESSKRERVNAERAKERYERFCAMKRDMRERRIRKERAMDTVAMLVAFTVFVSLFSLLRFCV